MADAHAQMLDFAIRLAEKEAGGVPLTPVERIVADVIWIDTQVSPNGFYGWLLNTPGDRMQRTLSALQAIGCPSILDLIITAMRIARVDPAMSADARNRMFDRITEKQLEWLMQLDGSFYAAVEDCMEKCRAFARREGIVGSEESG